MSEDAKLELLIQIRDEIAGLKRTQDGLAAAKKEATSLGSILRQGLGIGTGIQIATSAIATFKSTLQSTVGEAFRFAGQTKDVSEALGISAGAYQTLRREFINAGADVGRLTEAIAAQTRSLADARESGSLAAKAYKDLGLEAAVVERMPIADRLIAVARATVEATDKTRAFAAASEILGSRGLQQMLNALRRLGVEGVESLQKFYEKQGLIMSDQVMDDLDRAEKKWAEFWDKIVIGSAKGLNAIQRFLHAANPSNNPSAWMAMGDSMPLSLGLLDSAGQTPAAAGRLGVGPWDPKLIADAQARAAAEKAAAEAEKEAAKQRIQAAKNLAERMEAAREWFAADARQREAALKAEGEAVRRAVMTPAQRRASEIERLQRLLQGGAIDNQTFGKAGTAAFKQEAEEEARIVDEALDRFFGSMDRVETATSTVKQAAADLGFTFSSAFEDAIVSGRKLSDVLRGLAQDVARIALRTLVTEPLGKGVANFFTDVFSAGGGTFLTNGPTRFTVGDNPGGVELVSVLPISGVGQTRINGSAVQMAGGGSALVGGRGAGAGAPVTVNFNFATGVAATVRAEVLAMSSELRELAVNAVQEAHLRNKLRIA